MEAIQTCLIDSRSRTRIVSAIARGASGAGRTTLETAGGRGLSGIEYLGIWLLSLYFIFWSGYQCTFLELAAQNLGARLLNLVVRCGQDPHGEVTVSDRVCDTYAIYASCG